MVDYSSACKSFVYRNFHLFSKLLIIPSILCAFYLSCNKTFIVYPEEECIWTASAFNFKENGLLFCQVKFRISCLGKYNSYWPLGTLFHHVSTSSASYCLPHSIPHSSMIGLYLSAALLESKSSFNSSSGLLGLTFNTHVEYGSEFIAEGWFFIMGLTSITVPLRGALIGPMYFALSTVAAIAPLSKTVPGSFTLM